MALAESVQEAGSRKLVSTELGQVQGQFDISHKVACSVIIKRIGNRLKIA